MDDADPPTAFRGLGITGSKKGIDLANSDINTLTSGAVSYLEKRYSISGVMKDFDIFDPTNWPTTNSNHEKLWYKRALPQLDQPLFPSEFRTNVEEQWLRLKLFVCKKVPLSVRQFHTHWPRIIAQDSRFMCIMKLISVATLLPMNTAIYERRFSLMNRIKSESRSGILNSMGIPLCRFLLMDQIFRHLILNQQ